MLELQVAARSATRDSVLYVRSGLALGQRTLALVRVEMVGMMRIIAGK